MDLLDLVVNKARKERQGCLVPQDPEGNKGRQVMLARTELKENREHRVEKDLRVLRVDQDHEATKDLLEILVHLVRMVLKDPGEPEAPQESRVFVAQLVKKAERAQKDVKVNRDPVVNRVPKVNQVQKEQLVHQDQMAAEDQQGQEVVLDPVVKKVRLEKTVCEDLQVPKDLEVNKVNGEMWENLERMVLLGHKVPQEAEEHLDKLAKKENKESKADKVLLADKVNEDPKELRDNKVPKAESVKMDDQVSKDLKDLLADKDQGDLRENKVDLAQQAHKAHKAPEVLLENRESKVELDLKVPLGQLDLLVQEVSKENREKLDQLALQGVMDNVDLRVQRGVGVTQEPRVKEATLVMLVQQDPLASKDLAVNRVKEERKEIKEPKDLEEDLDLLVSLVSKAKLDLKVV